jgi:predicted  nucleic acid-binding Zn-ribbon protein
LDQKADKETLENLSTTVSTIQGDYVSKDEKTTMEQGISDAKTAADAAQEAADAAQQIANTVGDNLSDLQTTVSDLSTSIESNYETKDDADDKKIALEEAINDLATGAVADNTTAIGNEISRATKAESDLQTNIDNLSTSTTEAIATAKSEAISAVIGGSDDTEESNTINGVRKYVDNAMAVADAMTFKGVVDSETKLPEADGTKAGDTYKVGEAGYYAGYSCYVGDLLIAKADNSAEYYHISSGYEDDYNTRLGVNSTEGKVILNSPIGVDLGSVSFTSDKNSSLSVEVTGDEDNNFMANSIVKISLVWGSFGTTN